MGLVESYASLIVRRHCCVFWSTLVGSLLFGVAGGALLMLDGFGQGKLFAEESTYDWLVDGKPTVHQYDMVRLARAARPSEASGSAGGPTPLSQRASGNLTTTFMYRWRDGRDADLFSPAALQQMCEVENEILRGEHYGEVCFNDPNAAFYTTASGTRCALPRLSAPSLFYVPWQSGGGCASLSPSERLTAEVEEGVACSGGYTGMPTAPFWTDGSHTRKCTLLDEAYVAERAAWLYAAAAEHEGVRDRLGFFLASDALQLNETHASRSSVPLGSPVVGKDGHVVEPWAATLHEDFVEAAKKRLFNKFKMREDRPFWSPWRDSAETADLSIRFLSGAMLQGEFGDLMKTDFFMVIFSILFVLVYMCYHTGCLTLGCLGLLMILLSFPLALFLYVVVFRVRYFAMIHVLAIFIALGVGADDIFVYVNAWRHSRRVATSFEARIAYAHRKTYRAVLATSFTTAVAFFATWVSPVMPVGAFGCFAALAIVMTFALVISFFPAALMIWELRFRRAKCVGCCCPCIGRCALPSVGPEGGGGEAGGGEAGGGEAGGGEAGGGEAGGGEAGGSEAGGGEAGGGEGGIGEGGGGEGGGGEGGGGEGGGGEGGGGEGGPIGRPERLFRDVYLPAITASCPSTSRRLKPVSLGLVVCLAGVGGYLLSQALELSPPSKAEEWFPANHMANGFVEAAQNDYLAEDDDAFADGYVFIGLKKLYVDSGVYTKWIPQDNRGTLVYDDAFDLSDAAAQEAYLRLCDEVRAAPCDSEGCRKVPGRLVDPPTVRCLLVEFAAERGNVTGAAFEPELAAWVAEDPFEREELAGFVDGELKYVTVAFKTTMRDEETSELVQEVYDEWQDLLRPFVATAPASLASCEGERCTLFVSTCGGRDDCGLAFAWMVTQRELVRGLFNGLAICAPVAFAVLLLVTGSLTVALLAILSIGLVVTSLLGTIKTIGWELGVGEAIAGTIVIGLAVDYTVHLGHTYTAAAAETREGKTAAAATVMGPTVVAGAFTTFGVAFFMFFCQLTFFTKMATLIGGTVGYSLLYSLFFYVPLLALVGPSGKLRSTAERLRAMYRTCRGGGGGGGGSGGGATRRGKPQRQAEPADL